MKCCVLAMTMKFFLGGRIDDELGKCCCCTEMITKSLVRNLRRLLWLYMIVPLLVERSESRGHVVGTISLSSQGQITQNERMGNVCG
jgi:hypothetical protein